MNGQISVIDRPAGLPNYLFLLNPILARKDFPSKGLARYKKCRERGNNYIGNAVLGRYTGVAPLRRTAPIQCLQNLAKKASLVINVPPPTWLSQLSKVSTSSGAKV